MKKKTVVVTGGKGFIGSNLANTLARKGYKVFVIDWDAKGRPLDRRIEWLNVDVTNLQDLSDAFAYIANKSHLLTIDTVFHLAALPRVQYSIDHPIKSHNANVNGTLNVFLVAKEYTVRRVVYSASSSAYGDQNKMPFTEDMLPAPMSPYAVQKYVGECYARAFVACYGMDIACLRYFNVYGRGASAKGSYPQAIITFIDQRSKGQPLTVTGTGKNTRDSVNIKDVVDANIRAMKRRKKFNGEPLNIGSGRDVSVIDMAKMVGGKITHIAARIEPKHTRADIRKAMRELPGWRPTVSLEEGIAELKKDFGIKD
jgi:nucleoside-diphosphate-sugar epimerase